MHALGGGAFFSAVPPLMALAVAAQGLAVLGVATSAGQPTRGDRSGAQGERCLQLWSRRRRRHRQGAPDSGPGFRIRRPQDMGQSPTWWGTLRGDDGSDIGRCQSRRRWSNAASACGGVTRAAESGPALRGLVGGGGGRRSCAVATCSRRVDAPLMGLLWGAGTTAMAVKAGTGPASRPGKCARGFLDESLGDGDAVGRRFPVEGVVFPH